MGATEAALRRAGARPADIPKAVWEHERWSVEHRAFSSRALLPTDPGGGVAFSEDVARAAAGGDDALSLAHGGGAPAPAPEHGEHGDEPAKKRHWRTLDEVGASGGDETTAACASWCVDRSGGATPRGARFARRSA